MPISKRKYDPLSWEVLWTFHSATLASQLLKKKQFGEGGPANQGTLSKTVSFLQNANTSLKIAINCSKYHWNHLFFNQYTPQMHTLQKMTMTHYFIKLPHSQNSHKKFTLHQSSTRQSLQGTPIFDVNIPFIHQCLCDLQVSWTQ